MDATDRELLNLLQDGIPLAERPFAQLGRRLGLTEADVLARIRTLKESNLLRRIGASFDPARLGYVTTLAAARVPADRVDEAAAIINRHPEVTHNYEREDEFNVWFTVCARDPARVEAILDDVRRNTGAAEVITLPATRRFKLRVQFEMRDR